MSQLQKENAIKEILDNGDKMAGDRAFRSTHHLNKDDKVVTDLMGSVDGGMSGSEVKVDNESGKKSAKGQSNMMSPEEKEAAEAAKD